MKYRIPYYYKNFSCIGGECEDTCCAGWRIAVDRGCMRRYFRVPGAFGRRLRRGIDAASGCFRMKNRRCIFLNREGLCDIRLKLGKNYLCRDCRTYPRHMEDYGNLREVMLSLSCPEAARIILEDAYQGACREISREGDGQKEEALFWLEDARRALICLIKDRSVGWNQRLAMVLGYTHDLQRRVGGLEKEEPGEAVRRLTGRYLEGRAAARFSEKLSPFKGRGRERRMRINAWMRQLQDLEPVQEHWTEHVEVLCSMLYHQMGEKAYQDAEHAFARESSLLEQEWENLALYFIMTYFLGAVYDMEVFAKGKLAVFSCLIIREWCLAHFIRTGKFTKKDLVTVCCRYSREIENSDANLGMLEDMFNNSRLFDLPSMLTVLCGGKE